MIARATAAAVALALLACADRGADDYRAARARYEALVREGRRPDDPAFDEVRERLRRVPSGAADSPRAQELLRALGEGERAPPRPLAAGGDPCEPIARAMGDAGAEARDALAKRLAECRRASEGAHAHPEGGEASGSGLDGSAAPRPQGP